MKDPVERLKKLLEENNLTITISPMRVRQIEDGSMIIDKPQLIVNFVKEEHETSLESEKQETSSTA